MNGKYCSKEVKSKKAILENVKELRIFHNFIKRKITELGQSSCDVNFEKCYGGKNI